LVTKTLDNSAIEDINLEKLSTWEEVLCSIDLDHEFFPPDDDVGENKFLGINGNLVFNLVWAQKVLKLQEYVVLEFVL